MRQFATLERPALDPQDNPQVRQCKSAMRPIPIKSSEFRGRPDYFFWLFCAFFQGDSEDETEDLQDSSWTDSSWRKLVLKALGCRFFGSGTRTLPTPPPRFSLARSRALRRVGPIPLATCPCRFAVPQGAGSIGDEALTAGNRLATHSALTTCRDR